jgi:hypothetical protein
MRPALSPGPFGAREWPRLERLLAFVAGLLPFAAAIARAASSAQWRADVPALRDQGLVSVAFGGGVSLPVTQALALVPLGNHAFRAAVVSALGLGLGCAMVQRIARGMLGSSVAAPLAALLATVAALGAGLAPSWQVEATVGGGATVAAALALSALRIAMHLVEEGGSVLAPEASRRWLWVAALTSATLAENLPCGVALLVALMAAHIVSKKRPPSRLWPALAVVGVALVLLAAAPYILRPLAPPSITDLGRALSSASLGALDIDPARRTALDAWSHELGVVSLLLAAGGVVAGLFRERLRPMSGALVVLALCDLLYPLSAAPALSADPLAALRMMALAAFSVAASLGAAEVVDALVRLRIPMGKAAAALLVVFHITVVAVASEEAAYAADRSRHFAAEAWTDEALGVLPARSAVLVHSPELAWRLWSAQTRQRQRPDVLVIPAPLVARGLVPRNLAVGEEVAAQVLRDLALTGQATEFGLSLLADARPLHVELDRRWDQRVVKHLSVEGAWLRYAPQVLGRSDRVPPEHHPLGGDGRFAAVLALSDTPDQPSRTVLARTVKEHTATLALAGLGESSRPWLEGLDQLAPGDPFVVSARLRLAHAVRTHRVKHAIDLRDLLRF